MSAPGTNLELRSRVTPGRANQRLIDPNSPATPGNLVCPGAPGPYHREDAQDPPSPDIIRGIVIPGRSPLHTRSEGARSADNSDGSVAYEPPHRRGGINTGGRSASYSAGAPATSYMSSPRSFASRAAQSAGESFLSSACTVDFSQPLQPYTIFPIGEDGVAKEDEGVVVTNENAQAIFSPSACVFVANLPYRASDAELVQDITDKFTAFAKFPGRVWVTIRRDNKGNPYAFAQYHTDEEAGEAMRLGYGILIRGRSCRTEKAKANRLYYISRKDRGPMTEDEARSALEPMGTLELVHEADEREIDLIGKGPGFIVGAEYYAQARDAVATIKAKGSYIISQLPGKEHEYHNKPASARLLYYVDKYSIWVGNLPSDATENDLRDIFSRFGAIREVAVLRRPSKFAGAADNCFGLVDFMTMRSAEKAFISNMRVPHVLRKNTLKVEPKDSDRLYPSRPINFQNQLSHANLHIHNSGAGIPPQPGVNTHIQALQVQIQNLTNFLYAFGQAPYAAQVYPPPLGHHTQSQVPGHGTYFPASYYPYIQPGYTQGFPGVGVQGVQVAGAYINHPGAAAVPNYTMNNVNAQLNGGAAAPSYAMNGANTQLNGGTIAPSYTLNGFNAQFNGGAAAPSYGMSGFNAQSNGGVGGSSYAMNGVNAQSNGSAGGANYTMNASHINASNPVHLANPNDEQEQVAEEPVNEEAEDDPQEAEE